jgi:hypothetical protein
MVVYYPEIVLRGIQAGKHSPYSSFFKIPDPSPEVLPPVPTLDGKEIPSLKNAGLVNA